MPKHLFLMSLRRVMLLQQIFLMVLGRKKQIKTLLQAGKGLFSKAAPCIKPWEQLEAAGKCVTPSSAFI